MLVSEIDKTTDINVKFLSAMKILMSGQFLTINGYKTGLANTNDGSVKLYHVMNDDGYIVGADITIEGLYKAIKDIPEVEILEGLAGITLNKINKTNRI